MCQCDVSSEATDEPKFFAPWGKRWYPEPSGWWIVLLGALDLAGCLVLIFIAGSESPYRWLILFPAGPVCLGIDAYSWIKER